MKTLRNLIPVLLVFVAVACAPDENETNKNGENTTDTTERTRLVAVETMLAETGSFNDYIRVTGVAEAFEDAIVSSESSGRILEIAELGTSFKKGEIIARMDDRLIRAAYDAAKTGFDFAQDTFNRLSVLYADSIISTQDLNGARTQRDQAKAQLDQISKQLEDATIKAPFDGRVESRFVRTGELINPGMPVVRLVNNSSVKISAGVPERFARDVREGTPVMVNFRSNGQSEYQSSVSFAGFTIDPDTRTFTVEVKIENKEGWIKPEMVADLQILRRVIDEAVIIPRTAVVRDESGVNVFVSRQHNGSKVASLIPIETGSASGGLIQVLSGLEPGEEVVITGISNLSTGDRLNVLKKWDSNRLSSELQRRNIQ
jgi:RND family efflux transporter MFP subunit